MIRRIASSSFPPLCASLAGVRRRRPSPPPPAMSLPARPWTCSRCTFVNQQADRSSCECCHTPQSPSSCSTSQWSCRRCTFLNRSIASKCAICGGSRRAAAYDDVVIAVDEEELKGLDIGNVFWPLRRCGNRAKSGEGSEGGRKRKAPSSPEIVEVGDDEMANENGKKMKDLVLLEDETDPTLEKAMLKVLSYNVWFREDLELRMRIEAIGSLIQEHAPDLMCFQEVTPNILRLFLESDWWGEYESSVTASSAAEKPYFCMQMSKLPVKSFRCRPFDNSIMGRELCLADIKSRNGTELLFATSHLESPCPAPPKWDQMYSNERVQQANESIKILQGSPNVIFAGDMNWDDKLDGPFPLPSGFIDAWAELRPNENGWTYDTKANPMLAGNRTLQKRLDRFICKLRDFEIQSIEMVGKDAIPGLSYTKDKKVRGEVKKLELPVLPSDHFGLLMTISRKG